MLRKRTHAEVAQSREPAYANDVNEPSVRLRLTEEGKDAIVFKASRNDLAYIQSISDNIIDLIENLNGIVKV